MQGVEQQGVVTRQAQAAQQCTGIEAARSEAGGGERDRHPGQQDGGKAGQIQIAFGATKGTADLAIAVVGCFDALVRLQIALQ